VAGEVGKENVYHFAMYLIEGGGGFLALLIIPIILILITSEHEGKSHLKTLLENHFFDKLAELANRRDK